MSEWKETTLDDLIKAGSAELQTGPFGTMLNAKEYTDKGIPVIAVKDIGENKLLHEDLIFVGDDTVRRLSKYKIKQNDIIFGRKGAVERRALIKKQEEGWIQGSDCIRLRFDDTINAKFISYLLGTLSDWFVQLSTGATMPSLNQEILRLLPLKIPPLKEQNRIASILSSLDDKIDLLHRQNKTLEQLTETLFRQWFVDSINWNGKLSEYIRIQGGFAFKSNYFQERGYAGIIKIKNISMGSIDINNLQFVNEAIIKGLDESKYRIYTRDFLIAMTGAQIGKLGVMEKTNSQIWLNQRVGKLVPRVPYGAVVGYLALKSLEGQDYIINTCSGSAQDNISPTLIEAMNFVKYSENHTNMFGELSEPLFNKIVWNKEQIQILNQLRDSILPRLMRGETIIN